LSALISGDWQATADVPEAVCQQASGLVAAFASWHLDRGLRSLRLVER
ncbi:MAG: DNA repair protein RecO, partial [Brooklawnia sp.]